VRSRVARPQYAPSDQFGTRLDRRPDVLLHSFRQFDLGAGETATSPPPYEIVHMPRSAPSAPRSAWPASPCEQGRSTLASLWSVNDPATARLMRAFYGTLVQSGNSRARALQLAQQSFLSDPASRHPALWSAFVLVGR
jgi:hypothetical protein